MSRGEITLSVIKADVGGFVGHSSMHTNLIDQADSRLTEAEGVELTIDHHVTACGDDLELIMTHRRGEDSEEIHGLAWEIFEACTEEAKRLGLYGAGQDLLSDAFSGNIRGMGPGVAEMTFEEREAEPVLIFMADKTAAGAWNLPLYKIFADPCNTVGLVIAPKLHGGFRYEVHDVKENKCIFFNTPEELYDLLVFIGATGRYIVKAVTNKDGEVAAVSSTERLSLMAGQYVGKDDPVLIVRCQSQFPAVGEVLESFAQPHIVAGWMRGSHFGPLMPTLVAEAAPTHFDGPPRMIALGFQINGGWLVGPSDMFDDSAFDEARHVSNVIGDHLRGHGPFEPHRLPMDEMEYTTLPRVMKRLEGRWQKLPD